MIVAKKVVEFFNLLNTYQIPQNHREQINKITTHFHRMEWEEIDKLLMV